MEGGPSQVEMFNDINERDQSSSSGEIDSSFPHDKFQNPYNEESSMSEPENAPDEQDYQVHDAAIKAPKSDYRKSWMVKDFKKQIELKKVEKEKPIKIEKIPK